MTRRIVTPQGCNVGVVTTPEPIVGTVAITIDDQALAELVRDALAADLTDQTDDPEGD